MKTIFAFALTGALALTASPTVALPQASEKAAHDDSAAREPCKSVSRTHVKGEKGTPFGRCRVVVAQLRKD
jgi:hypothetical protein